MDALRFKMRAPVAPLVFGAIVLLPFTALLVVGSTRVWPSVTSVSIYVGLALLTLLPLVIGARSVMLARRGRAVVLDATTLSVPHFAMRRVDTIPLGAISKVEHRTVNVKRAARFHALWIHRRGGAAVQIREQDIGRAQLEQLLAALQARVPR